MYSDIQLTVWLIHIVRKGLGKVWNVTKTAKYIGVGLLWIKSCYLQTNRSALYKKYVSE